MRGDGLRAYPGRSVASSGAVGAQARIEWGPTASDLAHAVLGRETKAQRILARLRQGPATSIELAQITHRFGARLLELRRAGHEIAREDSLEGGREWSTYTLLRGERA